MSTRGVASKRRRLLGRCLLRMLAVALFSASAYSLVTLATLIRDKKSEAPWLPASLRVDQAGFWFVMIPVVLFGLTCNYAYGQLVRPKVSGRRWSLITAGGGTPAHVLGFEWLFSGWRMWVIGPVLALSFVSFCLTTAVPELRDQFFDDIDGQAVATIVLTNAAMIWALTLKGREVRRGKERIKVADEYLAIREARLHAEVDAMCVKFLDQQQDWKAQKTAELYEQILDQQARGLLPCPNCTGESGQHRKSA